MRHALTILTTTGLLLSALGACSLKGGDDDDDATTGGTGQAQGGSTVVLSGGSSNGGAGNKGGTAGTSGSTNSTGGGDKPPACEDIGLPADCGTSSQTADLKTVNMLLVVDKSGSMKDTPEGFNDTKWASLATALQTALTKVREQMNLGMILYPYEPDPVAGMDSSCTVKDGMAAVNVPIRPGTESVQDIVRIVQDTAPDGGTPTAAALQAAYNYYTTGEGAALAGDRYVLLATDGGPNCNYLNTNCKDDKNMCTSYLDKTCANDTNCCVKSTGVLRGELCLDSDAVVANITKLKNVGIKTYVVGIPGTEVYGDYLDSFAEASGQISPNGPRKFYEVSASGGVDALTETFESIVTQLVKSCDVPLDPAPDDPALVNVAVDCELKKPGEPGAGWSINSEGTTLSLLGTTCERIKTSGAKRVDLYYGCRPPQ